MFLNNDYIGLALVGNYIRMAHIKMQGDTIKVIKLDSFELAEDIKRVASAPVPPGPGASPASQPQPKSTEAGDVFGFDDSDDSPSTEDDDVAFEDLEAQAANDSEEDLSSLDMVNEAEGDIQSNPVLLYDIVMEVNSKSVHLALNISAGETIFQVISDTDFNEVKTKDLVEDLESKLESIYGEPKSPDNYAYEVREDGSLVLASVEQEAALLEIANETKEIYSGKIKIDAIYPDEVLLAGLLKAHYQLKDTEVTALIQFGPARCRITFMEGEQILQVMPIIEQGTDRSHFLNTVFSKLLFQLDTGKVPDLDQIVIANNTMGEEAVEFFRQNFPAITVQNFSFNEEKFDSGNYQPETLNTFTTAIATAWAATKGGSDQLPELSFLPAYVSERQKIFRLQWHGLLLLVLIFLSIPTINYFYQQNKHQMEALSSELEQTKGQINQVEPIVESTNEVAQNLTLLTSKLSLLDSLSAGSKTWSTKMDILDHGMRRIPNSWFTSLSKTQDGTFIEGYTLYRNRVPVIVDLFADATLLNVNIEEVRDEQIFKFSMIVRKFTHDSTLYSPKKSDEIEKLLNN